MLDFISKIWDGLPGWAKGIIGILLAAGFVYLQIESRNATADRGELWKYSEAIHTAVDRNALSATNPASQPVFVETPQDWERKPQP